MRIGSQHDAAGAILDSLGCWGGSPKKKNKNKKTKDCATPGVMDAGTDSTDLVGLAGDDFPPGG
jgi:hypothetical protein